MKLPLFVLTIFILSQLQTFSLNPVSNKFLQKEQNFEKVVLTPSSFEKNAEKYIGKEVEITGIVDHICKHGGKKMFLVDEKSNGKVKIITGDNMAAFTQELVGETVTVRGVVEALKVDEDFINNMENDNNKGVKHKGEGIHAEGKHEKDHENDNQSEKIKNLRKMLEKSGKDYILFFSVKASDYEIVK